MKRICDYLLNLRHLCAIFYFDTAPYNHIRYRRPRCALTYGYLKKGPLRGPE